MRAAMVVIAVVLTAVFASSALAAGNSSAKSAYGKKGAKVADLDDQIVDKWRAIARDTAWKDYAQKTPLSAELMKLAEGVSAS